METKRKTQEHFKSVTDALGLVDLDQVNDAVQMLRKVKQKKGMVWLVGNGGSAATAEHFANDLLKMAGIRAIPLSAMTSTVTAYGNDDGWEFMFKNPMLRMNNDEGWNNDVLVAISCSGNSPNVVDLSEWWSLNLIVLTGAEKIKNKLANISQENPVIHVEDPDITVQEDVHLAICHAIAKALVQ